MSKQPRQRTLGTPGAALTRYNPPGLRALSYRGGRYTDTLRRMLASLPAQQSEAGTPLAALNRDTHDDWSIALLHAWAVVTEVLGFYQERIVNEGYLRTAAEYRSVLELARAIGYELRPGVAAGTHLAFSVLSTKDESSRQIVLPPGVAVQGIPPQGRLPQIFETDVAFTARAEWNAIYPNLIQSGPVPTIRRDSPGLRLAGVGSGVQPGDTLLLLADQPDGTAELPAWLLAEVRAVAPDAARGQTALSWAILPGVGTPGDTLSAARVYALRPALGLFGYSRGGVYVLERPSDIWAPAALGMPAHTVRALMCEPGGALLSAADQGVFRSHDGGASWQSASVGLARRSFHALAQIEGGPIYAGGDGGTVFLSLDGGVSWTSVAGEVPPPPARGGVGPLPRTVVRALAAYTQGRQEWLAAGTDDGVLRSTDRGRTWATANAALPNADPKTGLAPVPARALAIVRRGAATELFAGTDAGVFHIAPARSLASTLVPPALAVLLAVLLFGPLSLLKHLVDFGIRAINWLIDFVNALVALITNPASVGSIAQLTPTALATNIAQLTPTALATSTARITPTVFARNTTQLTTTASAESTAEVSKQLLSANSIPRLTPVDDLYTLLVEQLKKLPLIGNLLRDLFSRDQFIFATDLLLLGLALALILWLITRVKQAGARARSVCLGVPVRALAAGPDGRLYAGTEHGLFCSNDGDEQTGTYLEQLGRKLTRALFGDLARFWRPVGDPRLATASVTALMFTPTSELLAGLADGQALRSADGAATWADLGALPLKAVLALMPLDDGYLAAGTPLDQPIESGWSSEARHGGLLDLALPAPDLAAGALVLLRQPVGWQPAPADRLQRIAAAGMIDGRDPARPARLTRLAVAQPGDLADFDRASLLVLARGPELSSYDDRPAGYAPGDEIACAGIVPGLAARQTLAISGRRVRATPPPGAWLESPDGLRKEALAPDDALIVLGPPAQPADTSADEIAWRVRTRDGREGLLRCRPGLLRLEPAHAGDEIVSELAELAAARHHDGQTTLTFAAALANIYDRSSVSICGNIVPASHGATVKNELLGSSEAMSVNQRFLLKQPPLAYVATPAGIASTLTLSVNGVRWGEVPFLHHRSRDQRVFVLRQDATSGEPFVPPDTAAGGPLAAVPPVFAANEVIFGDGVTGAGLPTGTWQIEATYRSGGGSSGNLPAGSLNVLQSAPRGIKAVTNPLPSGGGVDPETLSSARAQAPIGLRAMDRIVSLADYEDFARAYPGVQKVQMCRLARGHQRLLHLTIADAEVAADADDALPAALAGAIERRRAAPTPALYVGRCETLYFHIHARLLIAPAHIDRADAIRAAGRRALIDAFGFAGRALGQSLAASDIIRVLQRLDGVTAVEIRKLYFHGQEPTTQHGSQSPTVTDTLKACLAHLGAATIAPAQLLLINGSADDGIMLETMV